MLTRRETEARLRAIKQELVYPKWRRRVLTRKIQMLQRMRNGSRRMYTYLQKFYDFFVWDTTKVKVLEIRRLRRERFNLFVQCRLLEQEREQLQLAPRPPVLCTPRLERELARLA